MDLIKLVEFGPGSLYLVLVYNVLLVRRLTLVMRHILNSQQQVVPRTMVNLCLLPLSFSGIYSMFANL